jgi:hypothetical protein
MHTSDLFHKQPWSDGLVNLYDQLGVDYYENKYRWVLGGDGGGGGDSGEYDEPQAPEAYTKEGGQKGGYSTAEEAMSFFGGLTGARGTDQEYADLRAQQAAIEAGLPTFVNSRGITQNVQDGVAVPGDYLQDKIKEFNENPSIAISPVNLLSLAAKSNPLTAVATTAASVGARALGMPDVLTIDREGPKSPMFDALKDQVTGKADGGPIVPQGGIGNFYGR